MSNKPFDKKLYDANNLLCITIVSNFFISMGYTYEINPILQPEKFKDCDFELFKSGEKIKFEVERKTPWIKDFEWQGYSTLDVPVRKRDSKADVFVMMNNNANTLAIIKMADVLASRVITKDTTYTQDEEFFAVNLDRVIFVAMKFQTIKKRISL